jgi:glycosyltransferase involved in cell wall biosynthesis
VAGEFWGGTEATAALIAELGLAERVRLRPGYQPPEQVGRLFAEADALVLPYRSATSSQNAWIGFGYGLPVIATAAGALADPIRDGIDGLVCRPDDVADLARAIERFYTPGNPLRMRAAVRPVDPAPYWAAYLDALSSLASSARSLTGDPA